eukprot:308171-Rhodomonas_salina.4
MSFLILTFEVPQVPFLLTIERRIRAQSSSATEALLLLRSLCPTSRCKSKGYLAGVSGYLGGR